MYLRRRDMAVREDRKSMKWRGYRKQKRNIKSGREGGKQRRKAKKKGKKETEV